MRRFIFAVAAFLSAFAFTANAQMEQLPNDPAVRKGKLDNGMTYYIMHNENPAGRAEFYLSTNVGAIQETPDQDGLAHFLEHMCFNGTKNFPGKGIINYLQSIGASFGGNVNAATGVEQTTYELMNIPLVRQTVIDTCLLILHDYSHFVTCDPKEIDAERGVIIEERRQRRDANWRMHEKTLPYYYGDTKYGSCTLIGSQENLETFKPESLTNFYHTWYRPDLQAVIVVGDVDPDYVEAKLKEIFADIPAATDPKPKDVIKIPGNQEPIVGIITDPEAVSSSMEIIWKGDALPEEYNSTAIGEMTDILKSIISFVMDERLSDVTAKPEAPFLSASFGIGNLCETMEVVMGRVTSREGDAVNAFKAYLTEVEKMKKFGFSPDEIQRAKDNLLSYYESAAKKASTRKNAELVQPLINNFFDNYAYMQPEAEYELVKQICSMLPDQAVNQTVAQIVPDSNMVVIFKGPEKENLATPAADEFKQAIKDVLASDIKPNEVEKIDSQLLDPSKLKGSAVKSVSEGAYGSTVWMLKNGLKVVLRPSDLEKNRVIFSLTKEGGKSLIPAEDLNSFEDNIWATYLNNAGVSKYSSTVLSKMLAGKTLSVSPFISALRHGITGSSTTQDLETALQLVYLQFTDPRFNAEDFGQGLKQLEAILPNYVQQPDYKFTCAFTNLLFGKNPRIVILDENTPTKASLATIEKDYRMLFNDAAGAVLTVCGDFDIDTVRPMIEKYLGSIKKGKKALTWTDPHTDVLPGKEVCDFKVDMQTPKVSVLEVFTADMGKYVVKDEVALSAATYILKMRYTKSLREDEGGTYGAQVSGNIDIFPRANAMVQVYFDTKPAATDKLISLSLEGLNSLAAEGPTAEEFDMAQKNLQKNIPEGRILNSYWMTSLRFVQLYGIDYDKEYEDAVNSLTAEDVKDVLTRILSAGNARTAIMRPGVTAEAE